MYGEGGAGVVGGVEGGVACGEISQRSFACTPFFGIQVQDCCKAAATWLLRLAPVVAACLCLRAEAGMCARRRSNFLLGRQEKVTKEKAAPSLRPPFALLGERGQPAMLGPGVVPMNSLRSSNSAQTASASQITKCVCPSAHAPTPGPALLGAASRGGSGYRTAAASQLRLGSGTRAMRAADKLGAIALPRPSAATAHRAERSNGPKGARFHPLLTVPRSAGPGVSACRRTRASSSGSPKLFDRSCLAEAAQGVLRRHPRTEHRRLPPRHRRGGHGQRGRLFLAYLLLEGVE